MTEPKTRDDGLGSGFVSQVDRAGDKPILASLSVTSGLITDLVGECIDRRALYLSGDVDPEVAMKGDIDDCRALAELLMGRGPRAADYFVQPWNSPEQLGKYLVDVYNTQCNPEDSVFTHLIVMLTNIYEEMDFITDNNLDMEDQLFRIEGLIEIYAYGFTGLPYPYDED